MDATPPTAGCLCSPQHAGQISRRTALRRMATVLSQAVLSEAGCAARGPEAVKLETYQHLLQPRSSGGSVTVTFFGTTSLLFQDGETNIMSDGFVTRPERDCVLRGTIEPSKECIERTVQRLGIETSAALFVGHSHYDHAMDAPMFAKRTKARLVGSRSTMNVGRGLPLPESQLCEVTDRQTVSFNRFSLTFIAGKHAFPNLAPGSVANPLKTPAKATAWKSNDVWSVIVRHGQRALLVHGSANFERDALKDQRVEVVYLGIGLLRRRSQGFVTRYWDEVVRKTRAKRVILVHWDNLFRGLLDHPIEPLYGPLDDFGDAMQKVMCASAGREEVLLPVAWQPTDPFAGLS